MADAASFMAGKRDAQLCSSKWLQQACQIEQLIRPCCTSTVPCAMARCIIVGIGDCRAQRPKVVLIPQATGSAGHIRQTAPGPDMLRGPSQHSTDGLVLLSDDDDEDAAEPRHEAAQAASALLPGMALPPSQVRKSEVCQCLSKTPSLVLQTPH